MPSLLLDVFWAEKDAQLGNTIKPRRLQEQPTIVLHDITSPTQSQQSSKHHLSYVVTLTDPDAPSRDNPEWSEMCHWIVTNVTISKRTQLSNTPLLLLPPAHRPSGSTTSTDGNPNDLMEYKPPGPPPKTGKHRYVFLAFAPRNGTTEPLHLTRPKERQHWGMGKERGGVREWAHENGLVAVAGNFIYAKNKKQ